MTTNEYKTISMLLGGVRPGELAKRMGVSPARVSAIVKRATARDPLVAAALALARALHQQHRR